MEIIILLSKRQSTKTMRELYIWPIWNLVESPHWSEHYADKLHWFRSKLDRDGTDPMTVVKIATVIQRADVLAKGLTKVKFQAIRKLLCGW
jgi:hypothetical protein